MKISDEEIKNMIFDSQLNAEDIVKVMTNRGYTVFGASEKIRSLVEEKYKSGI